MRKLQRSNLFLDKETLHLHRLRKMGYQECIINIFGVLIFFKDKKKIVFYPCKVQGVETSYLAIFINDGYVYERPISYNGTVADYLDKIFNYLDKL